MRSDLFHGEPKSDLKIGLLAYRVITTKLSGTALR